jgi:hypothetical protein
MSGYGFGGTDLPGGRMALRDDGTWQMRLMLFHAGGNERTLDDQGKCGAAQDHVDLTFSP